MPTRLVGREHEVASIFALLQRNAVRMLTVCGSPGIGKTRLALEIARRAAPLIADDVYWVSLASVRDHQLVAAAISAALGLVDNEQQSIEEQLRAYLQEQRTLLVLDNFEQVATAAGWVAELVAACHGLKVLVTSRVALQIRGEQRTMVHPLKTPDVRQQAVEALARVPSVALFVRRAQEVAAGFALTAQNASTVAEICCRLDGLPLAIELASAWMRLLSPAALLARLQQRLPLLHGYLRDVPERQQSLRATLDWSYSLLTKHEQIVFRRLAVFEGGCSLEAAEAICLAVPNVSGTSVLDSVAALIDHSLVVRTEDADADTRVNMLEIIREYAHDQLETNGEAGATGRAHVVYFLELAETAERQLRGPEQRTWVARLAREYDNLRAALRWAIAQGDVEIGLRLVIALWWFWLLHGSLREGLRWMNQVLDLAHPETHMAAATPEAPSRAALRAKALHGAGTLAHYQGDYGQSRALLEQSLRLRRELGDTIGIANTSNNLALVLKQVGEYAGAADLYEESLRIKREVENSYGIATTLGNLAVMRTCLEDWYGAASLFEESLAYWRALGDILNVARTLANLGEARFHLGDSSSAASLVTEATALLRELEYKRDLAHALRVAGEIACSSSNTTEAALLYEEAIVLHRDVEDRRGLIETLEALALCLCAKHDFERAAQTLGAAAAMRTAFAMPLSPSSRARVDRVIELARSWLGETSYGAALQQGRAMLLDEVILHTLGVAPSESHRGAL